MKIQLLSSITHDGKFYTPGIYDAKDLPSNGELFLSKEFNAGHYGEPTARVYEPSEYESTGKVEVAPDAQAVEARKIAAKARALRELAATAKGEKE